MYWLETGIAITIATVTVLSCTEVLANKGWALLATFALSIALLPFILLPLGMSQAALLPSSFKTFYNLLFWLTFLFSWLILPFAQDLLTSGQLTWGRKIKMAICRQTAFIALCLFFVMMYSLYLLYYRQMDLTKVMLVLPVIATFLSQFWLTFLLGYGIFGLPIRSYRLIRHDPHYFRKQSIHRQRIATRLENLKLDFQLNKSKLQYLRQQPQYNEALSGILPNFAARADRYNLPQDPSLSNLEQTYFQHRQLEMKIYRLEISLQNQSCNQPSHVLHFILFIIFSLMSVALVLGEIAIFSDKLKIVSPIYLGIKTTWLWASYITAYITIYYMLLAAFYTLRRIKFDGLYELRLHKKTDVGSLIFYILQTGRLSFPISLKILQMAGLRETALAQIAGAQEPSWVGLAFPALLLLAGVISVLGWWQKLAQRLFNLIEFNETKQIQFEIDKQSRLLEERGTEIV